MINKVLKCAIYTRKSSEEGLEQDFNSLDAQREACEAYIKSQKHEGWELIKKQYNDGGFSGGTMNRPAFQELLKDVETGEVDIVVVYKVDRLTRSLMDFAKIVDVFDKHETSFVSITQQFNTTTSMGRLTLNILLSFAQFEREVTGERIRDKFAASKKKGMWINGMPPMGYVKKDGKLEIELKEAKVVKLIFEKYLEIGTVPELVTYLKENNIHTRSGKNFYKGHLYKILQNKTYIGKIVHKNNVYDGLHDPIINFDIFNKTQQLLTKNALIRKNSTNAESGSLLKGKLFDDKNNYMSPAHSNKRIASKGRNGQDVESCRVDPFNASNQAACKRYRYYVSQAQIQNRLQDLGSVSKISAGEIENFVTEKLKEYAFSKIHLQGLFAKYPVRQQKMIFEQIESKEIDVNFIRHALLKVRISKEMVSIIFSKTLLKEAIEYLIFGTNLPVEQKYDKNSIEELNYNIRISSTTKNGSKIIIGDTCRKEVNKFLLEAIVKSFYYHKLMFENKLTSEQKANTYIYRLMKLRFLPKNIIQDILTGNHEPDWTIDKLYTFL
mgnify:FL=1